MTAAPRLDPERPASVYLHAGELFASATASTIATIVDSCVTVFLFDPTRRIGGANHYLLPESFADRDATPRFGSVAIPELVLRILALGGRKNQLVAKIFGDAGTMPGLHTGLGAKNVQIARRILAVERIPIVAEDVGGERGRKIVFDTGDGHVWVREL